MMDANKRLMCRAKMDKITLLLIFVFACSFHSFGQGTVRGKITDEKSAVNTAEKLLIAH